MLILTSVGKGGTNRPPDVRSVQFLLNDWGFRQSLPLLAVDGLCGTKTVDAITVFQQRVTRVVDGRIDPNGPAIARLEDEFAERVLPELASVLLAALEQIDRAAGRDYPPKLLATIHRLRRQAMAAGGVTRGTAVATPVGRTPLGLVGGPPVFGFAGTLVQFVIIALAVAALIAALIAMLSNPAVQQALKNLTKLPKIIATAMSKLLDEIGMKTVEIAIEVNDLNRRFARCIQQLATTTPALAAALTVFTNLQSQALAKTGQLTTLAKKAGNDLINGQTVDPNDIQQMEQLIKDLIPLLEKLNRALEDVIQKCCPK